MLCLLPCSLTPTQPHAIITAVGTKVFLWDVATESWRQDPNYALLLNDGWNGDTVRTVDVVQAIVCLFVECAMFVSCIVAEGSTKVSVSVNPGGPALTCLHTPHPPATTYTLLIYLPQSQPPQPGVCQGH